MRLIIFILIIFGFVNPKSRCNGTTDQLTGEKSSHGYLLIGYPAKNLDSSCLKNSSGALMKNGCIIAMNDYFVKVLPDFEFLNSFDSVYKKNQQFKSAGNIVLTSFDRRFTGGDIAYLLSDTTLNRFSKKLIPYTKISTKLYFNGDSNPQIFVYRIFEFEANYINKKIENTNETQNSILGMTNLDYDDVKTNLLNLYFFKSFKYLTEVSPFELKSQIFIAIN